MVLKSDLSLDSAVFDPNNVSEETKRFNEFLVKQMDGPKWVDVGAQRYREMRLKGETALPAPIILPGGLNFSIPSRASHTIPCRAFFPSTYDSANPGKSANASKGTFMHIHGGGWVLFDEKSNDVIMQFYAETTGCVIVSIGYRLAPEDPWPAGVDDVEDAAEWMLKNERGWGELKYISGESAGGHLSLLACYHLLRTQPTFTLPGGLVLHFPATDLSHLPSGYNIPNAPILALEDIHNFLSAFLPNMSYAERKNPRVSPLYEDIGRWRGRLPRLLATCGTNDPLLDDSVFLVAKWQMAGGEATLKCYEGAPHAFIAFGEVMERAKQAMSDTAEWLKDGEEAEVKCDRERL